MVAVRATQSCESHQRSEQHVDCRNRSEGRVVVAARDEPARADDHADAPAPVVLDRRSDGEVGTLMDEVEFERVDDGTSLRMTKYIRDTSS